MELDVEPIIREYIDKSIHMSLGTTRDDKPWVCEVHFAYDEDLNLYFRSTTDRRHCQDIYANPNVAGNIVRQHELNEVPHGIYFEGTAELITDESQFQTLYEIFKQRQAVDETIIERAKQADGPKFHKITVENWFAFGKFSGDKVMKHSLPWHGGKKS